MKISYSGRFMTISCRYYDDRGVYVGTRTTTVAYAQSLKRSPEALRSFAIASLSSCPLVKEA